MLKNRLNHEVSKLIIDQMLNRFKRNPDKIFFDLALGRCDAFFDHLTTMLVSSHLCEMLNDCLVDTRSFLVSFKQD